MKRRKPRASPPDSDAPPRPIDARPPSSLSGLHSPTAQMRGQCDS
jgi:hypothetical protein